jgi:hypothetical protein
MYYEPGGAAHMFLEVTMQPNVWNHIAVIRAGSTNYSIYMNGELVKTWTDPSPNLPTSTGWMLGGPIGNQFLGGVDELSLFDRALSAAEVQAFYAAGSNGMCKTLTLAAQPVTQTVSPGAPATFMVSALGEPPLQYQWYFNNAPVGSNMNSFTVTNASPAWVGTYRCVVSNSTGSSSVTSSNASLWLQALKMLAAVSAYGPVGSNCVVQFTTNLNATLGPWTPLQALTILTNPMVIIDYGSADQPQRFYRTLPQ